MIVALEIPEQHRQAPELLTDAEPRERHLHAHVVIEQGAHDAGRTGVVFFLNLPRCSFPDARHRVIEARTGLPDEVIADQIAQQVILVTTDNAGAGSAPGWRTSAAGEGPLGVDVPTGRTRHADVGDRPHRSVSIERSSAAASTLVSSSSPHLDQRRRRGGATVASA